MPLTFVNIEKIMPQIDFSKVNFKSLTKSEGGVTVASVSVPDTDIIVITLNEAARKKIYNPQHILVQSAWHDGVGFLKASSCPDDLASEHSHRTWSPKDGGLCFEVTTHDFEIGVTHEDHECEHAIRDGVLVIQMPDWQEMLDDVEEGEQE